jgi:hypothetical protein
MLWMITAVTCYLQKLPKWLPVQYLQFMLTTHEADNIFISVDNKKIYVWIAGSVSLTFFGVGSVPSTTLLRGPSTASTLPWWCDEPNGTPSPAWTAPYIREMIVRNPRVISAFEQSRLSVVLFVSTHKQGSSKYFLNQANTNVQNAKTEYWIDSIVRFSIIKQKTPEFTDLYKEDRVKLHLRSRATWSSTQQSTGSRATTAKKGACQERT